MLAGEMPAAAGLLLMGLLRAMLVPISWIHHGSWLALLGLCLAAIDITAAVAVFRQTYRFLHDRWRIPGWFIGIPLLLLAALPIPIINSVAAFIAVQTLPGSLFP